MVIKIPANPFAGRDAELDRLEDELAAIIAQEVADDAEAHELRELIETGRNGRNEGVRERVLRAVGIHTETAVDLPAAEARLVELRRKRRDLRAAREETERLIAECRNKVSQTVCKELEPQFAAANGEAVAALTEVAHKITPIVNAHRELEARGVGRFIPQLFYPSGPNGSGKWDLSNRESWICLVIRQAVGHGFVAENDVILKGINWR